MLVVQLFVSKCQSSFEPVVFWPSSIKILKVKRFALTCFPWNYSSKITRIFPPKTKILMRKMEPSNCYMVCSHRFTCFFVSKLLLLFLYSMEKNKILLIFFFWKYLADQMHTYSHYSLREGQNQTTFVLIQTNHKLNDYLSFWKCRYFLSRWRCLSQCNEYLKFPIFYLNIKMFLSHQFAWGSK